jgi:putative membrane protein
MHEPTTTAAEKAAAHQSSSATTNNHLANERTFLAWVRTTIAVFGLGFIIAKFTAALRESGSPSPVASGTGIGMVLCGLLLLGLAYVNYRRTREDIEHSRYNTSPALASALTAIMALVGAILALYLVIGK